MPSDNPASPTTAAFAALITLMWPLGAQALPDTCKRPDEPAASPKAQSLRGKASRFAPRLELRFWFEATGDQEARDRAQQNALSPAPPADLEPSPMRHHGREHEPYGWQVSVHWNLVEMAEAVHPSLFEPADHLTPTECLELRDTGRRLLLEDDLAELDEGETR